MQDLSLAWALETCLSSLVFCFVCSQGLFVSVLVIIEATIVANVDGMLAVLCLLSELCCLISLTPNPSLSMLDTDDPEFPFLVSLLNSRLHLKLELFQLPPMGLYAKGFCTMSCIPGFA